MSGDSAIPSEGAHLFWPPERWQTLQAERLLTHLHHAATSPLYRDQRLVIPPTPADLHSLLATLPLTTKDQLAAAGPAAWAVAPEEVAEWVCTSGTAGKPLHVPLTSSDLERLADNEAVALSLAGVRQGDLLIIAVGMDRLFVAGLAYWLGARRLGATCIRVGPQLAAHPDMLNQLLERLNTAATRRIFIITVPSFLSRATPPTIPLVGIIAIGEPIRTDSLALNSLGERLHQRFHCPIMSTYAATETCATFAESPSCKGGHLHPALALLEILDDTGTPVDDGTVGEVVITPLGMRGMPLLRFKTGDMAARFSHPCPCGRTTPRLGPILGRKQQLLKLRGTSLFPATILEALRALPEVLECVIVAESHDPLSDHVTAHIHAQHPTPALQQHIESHLRALLRVTPAITFSTHDALLALQLSTGSRKPLHFLDRRVPHTH